MSNQQKNRLHAWASLATVAVVLGLSSVAQAGVPELLEQGRLLTSGGAVVVGPVSLAFSLYDAATAGNVLWTETHTSVTLNDGYFSVPLGSITPIPSTVFNGSVRYLGISVEGETEMSPRQPTNSVPYSLLAGNVSGDITPNSVAINGNEVINSSGQWVGSATGLVGPTGPEGPQGQQGPQGTAGQSVAGESEAPGANCTYGGTKYTSASGVNYVCSGAPGVPGATGSQGPTGETGATGPQGSQGTAGQSVVGESEAPGANCIYGGAKLTSASGVNYVCNGAPGATGATGPKGATGNTGSTGPQGEAGQSVVGESESPGSNCTHGGAKFTSASGVNYICNGAPGTTGPQGPQGFLGPPGPSGTGGALIAFSSVQPGQGGTSLHLYASPTLSIFLFDTTTNDDVTSAFATYPALVTMACNASIRVVLSATLSGSVTVTLRQASISSPTSWSDTTASCTISAGSKTCASSSSASISANTLLDFRLDQSSVLITSSHKVAFALTCQGS